MAGKPPPLSLGELQVLWQGYPLREIFPGTEATFCPVSFPTSGPCGFWLLAQVFLSHLLLV